MIRRLQKLLQRSDFRRNPVRGLLKRLWWRIRWCLKDEPWLLTHSSRIKILVPKSGSGALIYYQGYSEPEVLHFFEKFVKENMVVMDIGAHIGEYTLLAAKIVGESGRVYAFEPDPRNYELLKQNIRLNRMDHVVELLNYALSNEVGNVKFVLSRELSVSRISSASEELNILHSESVIGVQATTLDAFYKERNLTRVDVVKLDVEGAELLVLKGAGQILSQPPNKAPVVLFEYSPSNCARFGYDSRMILEFLKSKGYKIYKLDSEGNLYEAEDIIIPFGIHCNLVRIKDENT